MSGKVLGYQPKPLDELFVHNEAVSFCLLLNRRARTMRVIDFRAGATDAKRQFVRSLAQREGVEKIYTLVERDEQQTWVKLGFAKEGTIPGFYKRSDAFLLGTTILAQPAHGRPNGTGSGGRGRTEIPFESETRLVAARAVGSAVSPAQELAERTITTAKRIARGLAEGTVPQARVAALQEADARKAVAAALRSGRALTAFEPFGRDVERRHVVVTTRGGFDLVASIESQSCFGNAFLELLQAPRTEQEGTATAGALRALCDKLVSEGIVSCFSLAPSDDVSLAAAFLYSGFRRTGLLVGHLLVAGARRDAILWSRKLAVAADD
jgi:hypothetical protein